MVRRPDSFGLAGESPRSVRRSVRWRRSTAAGFHTRHPPDDGRVGHPVRCTNTPRASRAIRSPNPDVPGAAPGRRAHFRETFRPAPCRPAVAKAAGRRRLERSQRFPPVHGSVAQLPERPVVCGTVAGANPVGSANSHRGIAAQGRRVPHPPNFGVQPAIEGVLPDGVKVARRPVKPRVLVRVRVRQPAFRSQGARDPARRPAKAEVRGVNSRGSTNFEVGSATDELGSSGIRHFRLRHSNI